MKTNEIRIEIERPIKDVFEYTLEPQNKSIWCSIITEESVDTEQIGITSIYINNLGSFKVSDYERNIFLELMSLDEKFQCSYSFRKIDDNTTELIYFEAMLDGSDLTEAMDKKYFKKLKELLEI